MDEFNKAMEKYFDQFGEYYPIRRPSTLTDEEIIESINHCIENNTKADMPEYEDGVDY